MNLWTKKREEHILACTIRHQLPGRVRISCRALKYLVDVSRDLQRAVAAFAFVRSVDLTHITYNTVICYDAEKVDAEAIAREFEHLISYYSFTAFKGEREARAVILSERDLTEESLSSMVRSIVLSAAGITYCLFRRGNPALLSTGFKALTQPAALLTLFISLPIFRNGILSLRKTARPNADTLSAAAIAASVLAGNSLSALTVLFLHDSAELLTAYTMRKTRKAISDMLTHGEEFVWRLRDNGELEKVSIDEVRENDLLIVSSGEKISVDGLVTKGNATVDESSITGEFMPAVKTVSDSVYAGSIVKDGNITVRSLKVGDDTAVARIIKMVEGAADQKAPIQNFADRFSSHLLFVNLFLAASVYALTRNTTRALNMLIIDYSCALHLSTMAAFSAAINTAARNGVLIKGSDYIEALSEADTVILDKTGTVTLGHPAVVSVIPLNGRVSAKDIVQLATAAEETSSHPLARAIIDKNSLNGSVIPKHGESVSTVGRGVACTVRRSLVRVGNMRFMDECGISTDALSSKAAGMSLEGQSVVYVARGNNMLGLLGISDP
ncbi:MAG: HAD-IC family P-type ATPase, partial [Lentisphaeraceae bacterium]|nr:HAD-IC family P-type ATPase [Lentisphaeraceae bacterium]